MTNDSDKLYRDREHVLGDIVNAQPVFVRKPFANYADTGYAAFKVAQAARTPMVYVAANDGMLHAFCAGTSDSDPSGGTEAWAFIPTLVLDNLWKLADNNYANLHDFSVDGTPTVSDVGDTSGNWKTILVGGLGAGGRRGAPHPQANGARRTRRIHLPGIAADQHGVRLLPRHRQRVLALLR